MRLTTKQMTTVYDGQFPGLTEDFEADGQTYAFGILQDQAGPWQLWWTREEGLLGRVLWYAVKTDGTKVVSTVGPVRATTAHLVQVDAPKGQGVELHLSLETGRGTDGDYIILDFDHQPDPGSPIRTRTGGWRKAGPLPEIAGNQPIDQGGGI